MRPITAIVMLLTLSSCAAPIPLEVPLVRESKPSDSLNQAELSGDPESQINSLRLYHDLAPVSETSRLRHAAMAHALDMSLGDFFSHQGSDESVVGTRARRHGYDWCVIAENIAFDHRTVDEVMVAWANFRKQLENMLMPEVTEYGIARAPGDYWVLVLGKTGC